MWGGGAFQGLSFHVGTTSDMGNNAPNNLGIGVALMNILPINVEILHRATFLNDAFLFGVNDVPHSVNVALSVF